jgi:hypothetical protein
MLPRRSATWRATFVLLAVMPTTGLVAAIAHHAGEARWWLYALGFAGTAMVCCLPLIFAPKATIRFLYRSTYVSDEDARKRRQFP